MAKRPIVATYYFPNWHSDPRIEALHGKGWSEWRVTQHATPRFPGHLQPKVPLWGYQDESKPEVMEQKISAATHHGIDAFIFDWYCFNDGPYRERCLNEGFLKAANCEKIKFAFMWCNHNPIYAHPGNYWKPAEMNWNGENITPETFRRETSLYIEKYMSRPNYLRVDGGLYFSIWQPQKLIKSLGGEDAAAELIREFRDKLQKAGLGELNMNAHCDCWDSSPGSYENYEAMLKRADFNSVSIYNWSNSADFFPTEEYSYWMRKALPAIKSQCERFSVPFSPIACPGWDCSPRTVQSDMFEQRGYPFGTVIVNNTPDLFQDALEYVKELHDSGISKSEMIQIPCWNEWTEGSYLEPDTRYGYGFLQAVKNVFGVAE